MRASRSSLLAALLAISSPAAAAPSVWRITNFRASGARVSSITTYAFDIATPATGAATTHCVALMSTLPAFGVVPRTACADAAFSFSFLGAAGDDGAAGYDWQVWEEDEGDEEEGAVVEHTGVAFFPASDVVEVVDPSGNPFANYEYLDTAPDFELERVETTA